MRKFLVAFVALVLLVTTVNAGTLRTETHQPAPFRGLKMGFGGGFTAAPDASAANTLLVTGTGVGMSHLTGNATLQFTYTLNTSERPHRITGGTFTITLNNGDTITGTFQGGATPANANGYSNFAARYRVTGGTGRFASAHGFGVLVGVLRATSQASGFVSAEMVGPLGTGTSSQQ